MTDFSTIEVSKDGPVATVVLNRPDKLNSISTGLRRELEQAFDLLARVDSVRVVRLRAAGRAFSAGYDLAGGYEPLRNASQAEAREELDDDGDWLTGLGRSRIAADLEGLRDVGAWLMRLRRFEKPVVAQVHGYCLSGALDLIAICDLVVAGSGARFGHPAARGLGVPPLLGMLPFKVGGLRTKELLFTGDLIDAEQAERWGLINRVVADDELDAAARALCERVALMDRESLAVHKEVTNRWIDQLGLQAAVDQTIDLDAVAHENPFLAEFVRIATEQSVKAALDWRDGPYR